VATSSVFSKTCERESGFVLTQLGGKKSIRPYWSNKCRQGVSSKESQGRKSRTPERGVPGPPKVQGGANRGGKGEDGPLTTDPSGKKYVTIKKEPKSSQDRTIDIEENVFARKTVYEAENK